MHEKEIAKNTYMTRSIADDEPHATPDTIYKGGAAFGRIKNTAAHDIHQVTSGYDQFGFGEGLEEQEWWPMDEM